MHALDVIYRVLRTRVSATVEEHEQIMSAFNDVANIVKGVAVAPEPIAQTPNGDIPMPGKVSSRSAS